MIYKNQIGSILVILFAALSVTVSAQALSPQFIPMDIPPPVKSGETIDDPIAARRFHIYSDLGFAPSIIDMDDYNYGGVSLDVGVQYYIVRALGLGLRGRYEQVLFLSEEDPSIHFINLQGLLGYYLVAGLRAHLAVGTTIVGNSIAPDRRYEPYFSTSMGVSYTFWFDSDKQNKFGIELGTDFNLLFDDQNSSPEAQDEIGSEKIFAYLMFSAGVRYSLKPR